MGRLRSVDCCPRCQSGGETLLTVATTRPCYEAVSEQSTACRDATEASSAKELLTREEIDNERTDNVDTQLLAQHTAVTAPLRLLQHTGTRVTFHTARPI